MTNFLTALAIVVALLVAALVALRFWMAQPHRVFAEIAALPGLRGPGRAAATAIGRSLKRWKGPR